MQYYRVNIDKEETVSWRPEYETMIEKLRPLVRAGTGLMPWALPQFRIEVDPTELDGGAVLILGQPDEPCAISWRGVAHAWGIRGVEPRRVPLPQLDRQRPPALGCIAKEADFSSVGGHSRSALDGQSAAILG